MLYIARTGWFVALKYQFETKFENITYEINMKLLVPLS